MSSVKALTSVLVTLGLLAHSAQAAELTDAIPFDLARILFHSNAGPDFGVYADEIPPGFPEFEMPDGFTVVGGVNNDNTKRLALAITGDSSEAITEIIDALQEQGWISMPLRIARETGFVARADNQLTAPRLCHDELGSGSVGVADFGARQILSVYIYPTYLGRMAQTCSEQKAQQESVFATLNPTTGVNAFMPRLEAPPGAIPPGIVSPPSLISAAYPNRDRQASSGSTLDLDWTVRQTFDHFASQLNDQDWVADNESVSEYSANGIWIKETSDARRLIGTLSFVKAGENRIDAKFEIQQVD